MIRQLLLYIIILNSLEIKSTDKIPLQRLALKCSLESRF